MNGERKLLLDLIGEAYESKSWHGPNLRGSIRGLTARDAAWRPGRSRHNIWEIVIHAAYWKYVVRRRLTGEKRGSFELKGSNWFVRPERRTDDTWREDVELLGREHCALRDAIAGLTRKELYTRPPGSTLTNDFMIRGIAAHDLYHAGQIQIIKRLLRN